MKNRDYKIFAPDNCYHVFNRGVGKTDIFRNDSDYHFFLLRSKENLFPLSQEGRPLASGYIRKTLPAGAFSLLAYVLMPNHFHFLIRQNSSLPISKLMAKVCTGYSMYFNKKYQRVGALLQSKFRAVLVNNDSYLLWLSAYIHQNPKVAGLVKNLRDYPFSSYLDYIELRNGVLVDKSLILRMMHSGPKSYEEFVEQSFNKIKEQKDLKTFLLD